MRVGCGQAGALATPSCSCSAGTSPNPGGWASDDQPNAPLRCGNAALRDHRQTQFNAARSGEHCYLLTRRKDRRGRTATSQRLSRSVSSRAWVHGFTCTSEVLKGLDPAVAARPVGRLSDALAAHTSDDGVWFNSRAWIVTVRRH